MGRIKRFPKVGWYGQPFEVGQEVIHKKGHVWKSHAGTGTVVDRYLYCDKWLIVVQWPNLPYPTGHRPDMLT